MKSDEIRKKYLEFFEKRGHTVIPSASLVPENDPTTLFTGSGMQPLLPYLLGEKHPQGTRLVNSQKSFRAEDIEEVGDNRHTTFFEMLGNWSLGDYFKKEQLSWFFEFLTEEIKLDPNKLYMTVFAGDKKNGIPRDTESVNIWKDLFKKKGIEAKDKEIITNEQGGEFGMKDGRIFYYDAENNWWSRSGVPENMPVGEPGGPDSEVFYDFGTEHNREYGEHCHPNCDCGRFMEIGNSVFMEYIKKEDGTFEELSQKNVDFGGGLERIVAAGNDNPDIFFVDSLKGIIKALETHTKKLYSTPEYKISFRVIADHMRAVIFMIGDGVLPSNTEQGYFVRRLIRRSMIKLRQLGSSDFALGSLAHVVGESYAQQYPSLHDKTKTFEGVDKTITDEETNFHITLERGLKEFERRSQKGSISGEDAFVLYTSYGFPIEITQELASEKGLSVGDSDALLKEHQEISRKGAEQKFKGGLADTGAMSVKYHTATHLLHQALRNVLGDHVYQKGSNITPERLRFDFSHDKKMTDEEKKAVEDLVNKKIEEGLPVTHEDIPLEEAEKKGAIGLFEEKYGDTVRVYTIGDFSLEYCGGPHVTNTKELGHFTISKEEAISAGVRRIKATLT